MSFVNRFFGAAHKQAFVYMGVYCLGVSSWMYTSADYIPVVAPISQQGNQTLDEFIKSFEEKNGAQKSE